VIFVYIALAWLLVALGMTAGWALFRREFRAVDYPPDPVRERQERVAKAQAQIDRERARTGRDVVTEAAHRFTRMARPASEGAVVSTGHVAPLAAWWSEQHPQVPFDRDRWAGALGWTADQITAALPLLDTTAPPRSADVNALIRRTVERAAADRARAECRRTWDQHKGRAS